MFETTNRSNYIFVLQTRQRNLALKSQLILFKVAASQAWLRRHGADLGGVRHQTTSQLEDPGDSQLQKQNPVNDGETSAYKIYNVGKPIINHPSGNGLYHL